MNEFMAYLCEVMEANIPTSEKLRKISIHFGGTKQYIPEVKKTKEIYEDFNKMNPQRGSLQYAYEKLAEIYGVSVRTVRDAIAKERKWQDQERK